MNSTVGTYKTAGHPLLAWISTVEWFVGNPRPELEQRFLYHHKRWMASLLSTSCTTKGEPAPRGDRVALSSTFLDLVYLRLPILDGR